MLEIPPQSDTMFPLPVVLGSLPLHGRTRCDADLINQTTFTYDPLLGDLLQVIDPEGNKVNYTYNAFGRLTSFTDPNGRKTVFEYVEQGRQVYVGRVR